MRTPSASSDQQAQPARQGAYGNEDEPAGDFSGYFSEATDR